MKELEIVFESNVEIPRIRIGKKQSIATLIYAEALLIGKHLRTETPEWKARIIKMNNT